MKTVTAVRLTLIINGKARTITMTHPFTAINFARSVVSLRFSLERYSGLYMREHESQSSQERDAL